MKIISKKFLPHKYKFVVTIGIFDGLHKGHQFILKELIKKTIKFNARSLVITFWPHPKKILNKKFTGYIMNLDQKQRIFSSLGLDYLWILKTNLNFLNISGFNFIKKIIHNFSICEMIVGEDFRFGHRTQWGIKKLEMFARLFKFNLNVIKKISFRGRIISSSLIRKYIREAKFKEANKFLGRNYILEARVIRGTGLGRQLGFPTANLDSKDFVIPKRGVYAVGVYVDREVHLGAAYIGFRPTVTVNRKVSFEVHIFNFKKNILGKMIMIIFLGKIRMEKNFLSLDNLKNAIQKDIDFVTSRYSIPQNKIPQLIVF